MSKDTGAIRKENKIEICEFLSQYKYEVESLILTIMEIEFSKLIHNFPLNDLEDIEYSYGGRREAFFIALSNGKVVGTIAVKEDDEETALIRRVFVSPEHRGQGIGKALVKKATEFCITKEFKVLHFQGNSLMKGAQILFTKMGFTESDLLEGIPFQMFIMTKKVA